MKNDAYSLFAGSTLDAIQLLHDAETRLYIGSLCSPVTKAQQEIGKHWLDRATDRLTVQLAAYLRDNPVKGVPQ